MKKAWIIMWVILSFLLIYLLQVNFFTWFNLAGVKPNMFVILALVIGLFSGRSLGTTIGVFIGICLDFFTGKSIGISGIMLGAVGFFGGYLDKSFSKDSRVTIIVMTAIATLLYELGAYVFNYFINDTQISVMYFIKTIMIEIIFNSLIVIIIYPIIMKLGYKIESNFKENNILTRYF